FGRSGGARRRLPVSCTGGEGQAWVVMTSWVGVYGTVATSLICTWPVTRSPLGACEVGANARNRHSAPAAISAAMGRPKRAMSLMGAACVGVVEPQLFHDGAGLASVGVGGGACGEAGAALEDQLRRDDHGLAVGVNDGRARCGCVHCWTPSPGIRSHWACVSECPLVASRLRSVHV